MNRPKQTPDGFSVPGWGGLVAPPGAGMGEAGGSGSRWRPTWPAKGITFPDVSFQWNSLSPVWGRTWNMGDVTAQTWSPSVGWLLLLHYNHESQSNWEQLGMAKNISGADKEEVYLVCVCVLGGGACSTPLMKLSNALFPTSHSAALFTDSGFLFVNPRKCCLF